MYGNRALVSTADDTDIFRCSDGFMIPRSAMQSLPLAEFSVLSGANEETSRFDVMTKAHPVVPG
jgi:hypothetical protein